MIQDRNGPGGSWRVDTFRVEHYIPLDESRISLLCWWKTHCHTKYQELCEKLCRTRNIVLCVALYQLCVKNFTSSFQVTGVELLNI